MEVATTLVMDKEDGVIRILGTQTMLEAIGATKVMETKVDGTNLTVTLVQDINKVMVVAP